MMNSPMPRESAPAPGPLARFQDGFAQALLAPEVDAACPPEIARLVCQPGFAVYRNTVMKGCIDALQANYPSVLRLVGEEWFRAAAAIHVRSSPPLHAPLLDYGAGFAAFLERFEPGAELPYLCGVARLDRFWSEAHVACDEACVDATLLASLAPDDLARALLKPHAGARWAWFDEHPVFSIWQRNRQDGGTDASDGIAWCAEGALLVRPRDVVCWQGLSAAGCVFLDACAAGGTLAEAAAHALARDPGADLAQLMARLLQAGAFASLTLQDQ